MIYLPIIQIKIKETITEYYIKVKEKKGNIVYLLDLVCDFKNCCPICGGNNCAKFIEYYTRPVIDENGTYYKYFPIARFKCYGKGKNKVSTHKTFSLLPYQLIPYSKYSIEFIIIKTLRKILVENKSKVNILDLVNELINNSNDSVEHYLSIQSIEWFLKLIIKTINKLLASGYCKEASGKLQVKNKIEIVKRFIEFACEFETNKTAPEIRGPCALSYDLYLTSNQTFFLFGTPSQFRLRR